MTFQWSQSLPFVFSIIIKLASQIFTEYFRNTLVRDIPTEYQLKEKQKETIAYYAMEAHQRSAYIVTIFMSILSAAAISYANKAYGYALIAAFIFGIAGVLGITKLHAQRLGWLHTRQKHLGLHWTRGTFLTIVLIISDIILLSIAILSSIPSAKF